MTTLPRIRVLLIEREAIAFTDDLARWPAPQFDVVHAESVVEAVERLGYLRVDAILVRAPVTGGDELDRLAIAAPDAAIVVLLGSGTGGPAPDRLHEAVQDWLPLACASNPCGLGTQLLGRALLLACERKRLAGLALRDALTGLPNRRAIEGMLLQSLARARRHHGKLGVLFVDLDRFKEINDRLGHASGDQVLREVASRLRTALRGGDLVARLGGDEFLAVLEDVATLRDVAVVATKLERALTRPILLGSRSVRCTASIGVVLGPTGPGDSAATMIAAADAAMYREKRRPRAGAAHPPQPLGEKRGDP